MDESACLWKQLKLNKFPFYDDRLSTKSFHGDQHRESAHLKKKLKRYKVPWKGDSFSWEIPLNKRVKRRIVLNFVSSPQKTKKPPIYENRCSLDQKRKGSPYKAGKNR